MMCKESSIVVTQQRFYHNASRLYSVHSGGSKGGLQGRAPLLDPNSFNFMKFLGKIWPNRSNRYVSSLWGWRPRVGNSGSATGTKLNFDTVPDSLLGIWGAVGGTVRHLSASPGPAGSNRSLFSSSIVSQFKFTSCSPEVDRCYSAGEIHSNWYGVLPLSADKRRYVTSWNRCFTFNIMLLYSFLIAVNVLQFPRLRFYGVNIILVLSRKSLIYILNPPAAITRLQMVPNLDEAAVNECSSFRGGDFQSWLIYSSATSISASFFYSGKVITLGGIT